MSTQSRFKRIVIDGLEVSIDALEHYTELEWEAYGIGMQVDPETFTIVPIREQTKQWPEGDRQPEDYEGGKC